MSVFSIQILFLSERFFPPTFGGRQQIKQLGFLGKLVELRFKRESRKESTPDINCSLKDTVLQVSCGYLKSQEKQIEFCVY